MSEPTPEEFLAPLTLQANKNNAGQNPTNKPTQSQPQRALPTIGTRGQERGED